MTNVECLNKRIESLVAKRDKALRELRVKCKHLRLVEGETCGRKPHRICVDCGAEEDGGYCGWHVLILAEEYTFQRLPKGYPGGAILAHTSDWIKYRKEGPLYFVGQSHPNFEGGGYKTFKQLTAQGGELNG